MNLTKNKDNEINNWDEIKNFVGGAKKQPKHPLVQEMERMKMKEPEHYDEGGQVDDDVLHKLISGNENVPMQPSGLASGTTNVPNLPSGISPQLAQNPSLTGRAAPQNDSALLLAQLSQAGKDQTPSLRGLPGAQGTNASPGLLQTTPNSMAMPSLSSSAPSDDQYEKKASDILGGLDPAKISQLLENLRQQSNKSQIGAGIAGLGDAIASVGGQNPGHMKNAEEAIRNNYDRGLKAPELMANAGKERFSLSQQLQSKDPNSPYSKVKQNSYRQLFKSMGASDADINKLSADDADAVAGHQVTMKEALARIAQEGAYQQADLDLKKTNSQATIANQEAERNAEQQRIAETNKQHRADIASELNRRPYYQKAIEAIPGGLFKSQGTKELQSQLENGIGPIQPGQTVVHSSGAKITRKN